jgi:hypothetical protein
MLFTIGSMDEVSDPKHGAPALVTLLIEFLGMVAVVAIASGVIISRPGSSPATSDSELPDPAAIVPCVMNTAGYLNGRLYGELAKTIDWRGPEMDCDGMTRPNNNGIRLIFASPDSEDAPRLIFVIGIDGELENLQGQEEKVNITIIDQASGRFYSTVGRDRCWTTVESVAAIPEQASPVYRVDGELYCAGALPSLSGKGSVTLGDFRYSGRVTLDDS